eukprot:XP_001694800.1 predicted protein [Chlamydomonas reinhardtii]
MAELGQLQAGALVFAAWVARSKSRFPEVVYYCSSDVSEEQLGRADHEQLLGALQSLTSQHLLGQLCGLAPEQVAVTRLEEYDTSATSSSAAPTQPADVKRSHKERLQRLLESAGQCSDGPFLAYVLTAGHKVVVKQLVGGGLARATFCSEEWGAAFEDKMYIARTTWPPGAMSMELPAGHLGWYAAFLAYGRGAYVLHPTAESWLLPDAVAEEQPESTGHVWRISSAPVAVQLEQRLGQPPRMTCTCSSFRVVGAAVSRCLHTAYVSSVEWLLEAGPPPPRLVPAARCARSDDGRVLPGDYIWLPGRTLPYTERRVATVTTVYGPDTVGPVRAHLFELYSGCSCLACVMAYDGVADGLFRYSRSSFFCLRHMYTYADQLLGSGMNVEAYVSSQRRLAATTLLADAQRPKQFSATLFRRTWQQFEARLDRFHTFKCPICDWRPRVLICDATAITFLVEHYRGTPVTTLAAQLSSGRREHKRSDRCWCPEEKGRSALRGFSSALLGDGKDVYGHRVEGWAGAADSVMLHSSPAALEAVHASLPEADRASGLTVGFVRVVSSAVSSVGGVPGSPARLALARLLDCMGSTAPAVAYMPLLYTAASDACAMVVESQPQHPAVSLALATLADALKDGAPVLSRALTVLSQHASIVPVAAMLPIAVFLRRLSQLAQLCGTGCDGGPSLEATGAASAETDECLLTANCCGLGVVRPRYAMGMDGKSGSADEEGGAASCKHNFCARGPRTGGIFTVFCEHGVCYAFFVLPRAEGRNEMYSWMVSFLPRAPEVVVYDFACSLHEYCLNRAPAFFCGTRFVVDRFHWSNHTGCSHAYNMSLYPDLDGLNSEVAEQVNSQLQPYKSMVSQMRQDNFMSCLRFVLGSKNTERISKIMKHLKHALTL